MPSSDLGSRSTQFVSLDTHPANNALVVVYDILVVAVDALSRRELMRASKRQQLLVNISILNLLDEDNPQAESLSIDLNELATEIVRKCPLLSGDMTRRRNPKQNIEDIKLHLLYLINRRQAQISAKRPDMGGEASSPAQMRPRQAIKSSIRRTAVFGQQRPTSTKDPRMVSSDVYTWYLHKPNLTSLDLSERHLSQLDAYLDVEGQQYSTAKDDCDIKSIETYLDGLYSDRSEKIASIIKIRRLIRSDANLVPIGKNRVLICALMRTLTDSIQTASSEDNFLCDSILFCMIRLTLFSDIHSMTFREQENLKSVDLMKIILDFISYKLKTLLHDPKEQLKLSLNNFYHGINSALLILINLTEIDEDFSMHHQLVSSPLISQFHLSLVGLLQLISKQLARNLRISTRSSQLEPMIALIRSILRLMKRFTALKEFISEIRGQSNRANRQQLPSKQRPSLILDPLISLIGTLQLSRPGSGQAPSGAEPLPVLLSDQSSMNQFYELELDALEVANQLLIDHRLRARMVKRNLLKCVLRNIVSFLASRGGNFSFDPFHRSPALMTPLACLYELSCQDSVKFELYKSRIIIRCLIEYLLTVGLSLKQTLSLAVDNETSSSGLIVKPRIVSMNEIKLAPKCVSHYVLSIWCNLSARQQCSIYGKDEEIRELLFEYISLASELVSSFSSIWENDRGMYIDNNDTLSVYLHLKLLRNLSQFIRFGQSQEIAKWLEQLTSSSCRLIEALDFLAPISVECLAVISNTLTNGVGQLESVEALRCLIEKLFSLKAADLEAENDDLLLVSINLLGSIARTQEICIDDSPIQEKIYRKSIVESNFVLDSRSSDEVMILSCLFAISQMMKHRQYLSQLASQTSQANELISQLATLMLSSSTPLVRLACQLANKLRYLELSLSSPESQSAPIHTRRFICYNGRWLDEIRTSRDEPLSPDEIEAPENWPESDEDNQYSDFDKVNDAASLKSYGNPRDRVESEDVEAEVADELDEEEISEENQDGSGLATFDFNVIDSNSMIKHLISRRELRSQWLQNR